MSSLTAIGRFVTAKTARPRVSVASVQAGIVFAALALPFISISRDRLPVPGSISVYLPDVLVVLALVSWFCAWLAGESQSRTSLRAWPLLGWPLVLFALALVPGILRGHERFGASLVAQPVRLVLYAGIAAAVFALRPRTAWWGVVCVFYAGTVWEAGLAVYSLATGESQTAASVLSTGGTRILALSAALYLACAFVLALVNVELERDGRRRLVHAAFAALALFGIVVSYGRTVFAALALVLIWLLVVLPRMRTSFFKRWYLALGALVLAAAAVAVIAPGQARTLRERVSANPVRDSTFQYRLSAIEATLAGMRSGHWQVSEIYHSDGGLLKNAGFENGTADWFIQDGDLTTTPSNNKYFGERSLVMKTDGEHVDEGAYSTPVFARPGQTWRFSIWLKGVVGGEKLNLGLWEYNRRDSGIHQTNLPITLTSVPTEYIVTARIEDPTATHFRVLMRTRAFPQRVTVYADRGAIALSPHARPPLPSGAGLLEEAFTGSAFRTRTPALPFTGVNHLSNSGFETGTKSWRVRGGTGSIVPPSTPDFGAHSFEVVTNGRAGTEGLYSQAVPVRNGQLWSFAVWLTAVGGEQAVNVELRGYDKRGRDVSHSIAPVIVTDVPSLYFVTSSVDGSKVATFRGLVHARQHQPLDVVVDDAGLRLLPPKASGQATSGARGSPYSFHIAEPILGLGFGRTLDYVWRSRVYHEEGDPHNSYVYLLAGGGALALGAFLLLVGRFFLDSARLVGAKRGLERSLVVWAIAAAVIMLVNAAAEPILTDQNLLLSIWIFMLLPALVIARPMREARREVVPASAVARSHYFEGYDNASRFSSYWHQIDETSKFGGPIVEVGVGNGTVTAVLRARGHEVTTVDIDPDLAPDVQGDVRRLPFEDDAFETALAAEVLEHLPWDDLPRALGELARVARRGVVVSVPNSNVALVMQARVPNALHVLRMVLRGRLPVRHGVWALLQRATWRRRGGIVRDVAEVAPIHKDGVPKSDQHYWEIGLNGIDREGFVSVAERAGLHLVRDFRGPGYPYHHFFVLAKSADETIAHE